MPDFMASSPFAEFFFYFIYYIIISSFCTNCPQNDLRREAQQQEMGYLTFLNRSQKLLKQENKPLHRPESWKKRAALWGSVQLNTLKDSSNGHLAEMMVNGINMGIVKMTKKLNDFPESGEETKHLTKNFLRQQEQQIENLKKYL